ncbi:hypothetical protein [Microbulbifer guangxiensis]|uniref:hypothetical protein n=1 Tax=Microbulbifer guangxiensis TaxID=2904249 RepID=UPI001F20D58D|nr:hypothetical protein [Microbulbifer guangxiensis]
MLSFKVMIKWTLSFLKEDWVVRDYPVRIREQPPVEQAGEGLYTPRFIAQIENWWQVAGVGETREEALEDLGKSLVAVKERRGQLPRPGTGLPIEFAATDEIGRYWGIVSRIISEVLEYEPEDIFITDGSSLWDFTHAGDSIEELRERVFRVFDVNVSHIESANIAEIARYISEVKGC